MDKKDFLKLRIRKFIQTKKLKAIAADYFPVTSDYHTHPNLYNNKTSIIDEMEKFNIIEDNYEAILQKVNALLG
ncbi:MAG TPA: hypothetical protein VJY62_02335 [Bacteroidia bacterium]|nr:hypothetical protein [Bacteroidia bacterium]